MAALNLQGLMGGSGGKSASAMPMDPYTAGFQALGQALGTTPSSSSSGTLTGGMFDSGSWNFSAGGVGSPVYGSQNTQAPKSMNSTPAISGAGSLGGVAGGVSGGLNLSNPIVLVVIVLIAVKLIK
jgi:hypothetical protein